MFFPRGSSDVLGPDVCGTEAVDSASSRWSIVIATALTTGCGGDTAY